MIFIYDNSQINFLYNSSFLTLFSFFYAIYNKNYNLCIVPGGVFLTSINYWRNPMYGWRRNLDITYVGCALIYQAFISYSNPYFNAHLAIMSLAMTCYPISIYYYNNNKIWHSVYFHSGIHIFANIANIILYHGKRMTE